MAVNPCYKAKSQQNRLVKGTVILIELFTVKTTYAETQKGSMISIPLTFFNETGKYLSK